MEFEKLLKDINMAFEKELQKITDLRVRLNNFLHEIYNSDAVFDRHLRRRVKLLRVSLDTGIATLLQSLSNFEEVVKTMKPLQK